MSRVKTKLLRLDTALLTGAAVCGAGAILALRANNLKMLELRNRVQQADEKNEGVEQALRDLQAYVGAHMNTSLGGGRQKPVQLAASYDRYVARYQAEEQSIRIKNAEANATAQNTCEQQFPGGASAARRQCITDYVQKNGTQPSLVPPDSSYFKYDFVSPAFALDIAGALILGFLVFFGAFVARRLTRRLGYFIAQQ